MEQLKFNEEDNDIVLLLKNVIDPELMVNIIDLGLVYQVVRDKLLNVISIDLTLTSPGCPLGDAICADVEQRLLFAFPGYAVRVNLVWEPQWSTALLSPAGRLALEG